MDFHEWIKQQAAREDAIGRLAEQLLADPICPFWSNRLSTYRCYLIYRSADPGEMRTFESAFSEWRAWCAANADPHTVAS